MEQCLCVERQRLMAEAANAKWISKRKLVFADDQINHLTFEMFVFIHGANVGLQFSFCTSNNYKIMLEEGKRRFYSLKNKTLSSSFVGLYSWTLAVLNVQSVLASVQFCKSQDDNFFLSPSIKSMFV